MTDKEKILEYIAKHKAAALATVDDDGVLHSAAVYIYAKDSKKWYTISKLDTKKARNLAAQPRFSATIFDRSDNSTLQARGIAKVEKDDDTIGEIMNAMAKIYGSERDYLPPVAKIQAGDYVIIRLEVEWLRFAKFGGVSAGSEDIFVEL
ncbi:MAG: pyridoxamine 5'-phosphate oxidase family protein [Patescibacteria group bacterium]